MNIEIFYMVFIDKIRFLFMKLGCMCFIEIRLLVIYSIFYILIVFI